MKSHAEDTGQVRAMDEAQIREYRRPPDPAFAYRFHDYQCRATGARGTRCRMSVVARIADFDSSRPGASTFDPNDPRCLYCRRHLKLRSGESAEAIADERKVPATKPYDLAEPDESESR